MFHISLSAVPRQTESDPQIIASYLAGIGITGKMLITDNPNDRNEK